MFPDMFPALVKHVAFFSLDLSYRISPGKRATTPDIFEARTLHPSSYLVTRAKTQDRDRENL